MKILNYKVLHQMWSPPSAHRHNPQARAPRSEMTPARLGPASPQLWKSFLSCKQWTQSHQTFMNKRKWT